MSDWYYAANNEQKGPVNEVELKENFASRKLPLETLVWKDGMDNWTPANQIPAFAFRQPPEPAKLQPPAVVTTAVPGVSNPSSVTPVDVKSLMGTPEALEVAPEDADKNKIFGILAYLGILCLVPMLAAKDSPFAKYHANQGLVLFVLEIVIWIVIFVVNIILSMLPSSLGMLSAAFGLLYLAPLILAVFGIINAAASKCVPLPVIGGIKLLR